MMAGDTAPSDSPTVGAPPGRSGRREEEVLQRIERARQRKPKVREERITLAHGAGGKATQTLVQAVFLEALGNSELGRLEDGATLAVDRQQLAFSTDSFVVSPLFFPGGCIGDLAVNGTVNDLAACGAQPLALSAAFVLEEGFPVSELETIAQAMGRAATAAGVPVVTGDTKVVERGKADGCYITTAGVGIVRSDLQLSASSLQPGDRVLVSGPIGDHGATVMMARGDLDIAADIVSDTAPLHGLVAPLLDATHGVRALRDATRGGVATVCNELAVASGVSMVLDEAAVPVRPAVNGACELLGIDPLYVACEGRLVAVVEQTQTDVALEAMRRVTQGVEAAVIGEVRSDPPGMVLLRTSFGGTRIVDLLVGDPLPRIC